MSRVRKIVPTNVESRMRDGALLVPRCPVRCPFWEILIHSPHQRGFFVAENGLPGFLPMPLPGLCGPWIFALARLEKYTFSSCFSLCTDRHPAAARSRGAWGMVTLWGEAIKFCLMAEAKARTITDYSFAWGTSGHYKGGDSQGEAPLHLAAPPP